jgi:hypothetical protein
MTKNRLTFTQADASSPLHRNVHTLLFYVSVTFVCSYANYIVVPSFFQIIPIPSLSNSSLILLIRLFCCHGLSPLPNLSCLLPVLPAWFRTQTAATDAIGNPITVSQTTRPPSLLVPFRRFQPFH